jgi:hypothetical protein
MCQELDVSRETLPLKNVFSGPFDIGLPRPVPSIHASIHRLSNAYERIYINMCAYLS